MHARQEVYIGGQVVTLPVEGNLSKVLSDSWPCRALVFLFFIFIQACFCEGRLLNHREHCLCAPGSSLRHAADCAPTDVCTAPHKTASTHVRAAPRCIMPYARPHPTAPRPQYCTVSADGTVRIWDLRSHQQLYEFDAPGEVATAVAYHPRHHELAVGFENGRLRIFDVATTTLVQVRALERSGGSGAVRAAAGQRWRRLRQCVWSVASRYTIRSSSRLRLWWSGWQGMLSVLC